MKMTSSRWTMNQNSSAIYWSFAYGYRCRQVNTNGDYDVKLKLTHSCPSQARLRPRLRNLRQFFITRSMSSKGKRGPSGLPPFCGSGILSAISVFPTLSQTLSSSVCPLWVRPIKSSTSRFLQLRNMLFTDQIPRDMARSLSDLRQGNFGTTAG